MKSTLFYFRNLCVIIFITLFIFLLESKLNIVTAQITFETLRLKITISDNAQWQSIIDKSTGKELCASAANLPFAEIVTRKTSIPATSIKNIGSNIQIGFKDSETKLTYGVTQCDDWLHFQLTVVDGPRPQKIILCQVPVTITENVGSMLNIAWDNQTSICLMAANFQPDCRPQEKEGSTVLQSLTQDSPGPPLEGSAVALIVCPTPEIRKILRTASHFFGLIINEDYSGVPSKESLIGRQSYWFLTEIKESDAERIIEYCKKTNFKQIIILFSSWAKSAGHIEYNTKNFPDGKESLKRFIKKLNDADIGVGSHTFVSKISKTDPYIFPVPDKRFWVDMKTNLSSDIGVSDTEIKVSADMREWPGSPACSRKTWEGGVIRHQEVVINDEIIKYKSIGPEGVYNTFMDCERGSWGTKSAAHKTGETVIHWGVDGGINGYIIDQETTLLDEVCDRMAYVFNECGFNMVYFDGGEDVPRDRFDYYASLAQLKALKKFQKKPFIHMGTVRPHRLWHSFTIGSTVDTYLNTLHGAILSGQSVDTWPTVKDHINRSVQHVIETNKSFVPGELGWFGIWPKGEHTDGLQLDEIEYLMAKSLAYDAPISLETGWKQMDSHPLTPEILNIVGVYEKMRINKEVPNEIREQLKEVNKDFAYVRLANSSEFVEMTGIPQVTGAHDIRSYIGTLKNGDVAATIWHYLGTPVTVQIPSSVAVKVIDLSGNDVPLDNSAGQTNIQVSGSRLALIFHGISKENAANYLAEAKIK
ncbi:MAG: hypothetical protein M1426_05710 [Patescibacteria group bacterium]|nr:hypothetical protein [Patescibacteria group bacterium]